jgi:hypothetical protein
VVIWSNGYNRKVRVLARIKAGQQKMSRHTMMDNADIYFQELFVKTGALLVSVGRKE